MIQPHPSRFQFKEINLEVFFESFLAYKEAEAIQFLKIYKLHDLVFLRGLAFPGQDI